MTSRSNLAGLTIAALGIVFGDIGTSPLYAFKEAFHGTHALPLQPQNVYGVLSMMFWSVTLIVSLKYVIVMLKFDNRGEGGVLALLAMALRLTRSRPRLAWVVSVLGVFAASLFYGDAVITPAITVLSAVEGLSVARPRFEPFVLPLALAILIGLFAIQRFGTGLVGKLFGPVMILWFGVLAWLGVQSIVQSPQIIGAISPTHALRFALQSPGLALLALGAVFLCVTGAEALYADLGHFGKNPVRLGWFAFVFPALMLNYLGQGALVLRDADAVANPFFMLAPEQWRLPLVALATAASVIASQAVISGAFSVTQNASRLNLLPRMRVQHTSETTSGQIYIPLVNWILLFAVLALVAGFRSSSSLAAAYGLAVNGDLLISTVLLGLVMLMIGERARVLKLILLVVLFLVEFAFMVSNLGKFADGGWFPVACAALMFTILTTWNRGIDIMRAKKRARPESRVETIEFELSRAARVPGAAVFFSSAPGLFPTAFLHNLKHNKVAHETIIFMTVTFVAEPFVPEDERFDMEKSAGGAWAVNVRYGFLEQPDLVSVLKATQRRGLKIDLDDTSYFTSKPTVVSVSKRGLFGWRRSLFGWMLQQSPTVADYFRLPPNRVVELGTQIAV